MQRVAAVQVKAPYQILQGARENLLLRHYCVTAAAMVDWGQSPSSIRVDRCGTQVVMPVEIT